MMDGMDMENEAEILAVISSVACSVIIDKYNKHAADDLFGMVRFDGLKPKVLAACMNAISRTSLFRNSIPDGVDIKLPEKLVDPADITDKSILYPYNAAAARNSQSDWRLLVFANGAGDIITDTLKDVDSINESDLLRASRSWAKALTEHYTQLQKGSNEISGQLQAMIAGFTEVLCRSLELSACFFLNVAESICDGSTIDEAVNQSLHILGFPCYEAAMPQSDLDAKDTWVSTFKLIKKIPGDLFLDGQRPYALTSETLCENLNAIKYDLKEDVFSLYLSVAKGDGKHEWNELIHRDWVNDYLGHFVADAKVQKTKKTLARETLDWFATEYLEALDRPISGLSVTLRGFLESHLNTSKISEEVIPEARLFYAEASSWLANNPKLDRRWEKLLFKDVVEGEDFIDVILQASMILSKRVDLSSMKDPVLLLFCTERTSKIFFETNGDLLGYFSLMYRGLEAQCGDFIAFRFKHFSVDFVGGFNPLFHYGSAKNHLRKDKNRHVSTSISKDALRISFKAYFVERENAEKCNLDNLKAVKLVWHLPSLGIGLSLARDFKAVAPKTSRPYGRLFDVVFGRNFKQTNSRGLISEISLSDAGTFGLPNRTLVFRNSVNLFDLKKNFECWLNDREWSGINVSGIKAAWDSFCSIYLRSIVALQNFGLGAREIPEMHAAYAALLRSLTENADRSQEFRGRALSYPLSIGVFSFVDQLSANAVVTPWNPLRLFELHREFVIKTGLIKALLSGECKEIDKTSDFISSLLAAEETRWPSFVLVPQHGAGFSNDEVCRELLAPIECASGYSLYSRIVGKGCRDEGTSDVAARELTDIVANNYLKLMPQATNCLRLALPDAASQSFPMAVVKSLVEVLPEHEQLSLTMGGLNTEGNRAETEENLYQGLISATAKADSIGDATFVASSLKSRIQLSVFPHEKDYFALKDSDKTGVTPFDVVYIDRFFTYNAVNKWLTIARRSDNSNPYNLESYLQQRSRRLVRLEDEYVSTTLLSGDVVSDECHAYIDASRWLMEGKSANLGADFAYPCLEVNCDSPEINRCIRELHNVAHWVVTSNDLIDRRQLINNDIKIVRYKRNPKTGKTSIVSSEMPTDILSQRIEERLLGMGNGLSKDLVGKIAEEILQASYRISGYVALRAARQETNANEIIGLVLSNWLAISRLEGQAVANGEKLLAATSFLLDDFSSVFKSRSKIADLLCILLSEKDGQRYLHLYVTEAKFCGSTSLSVFKLKSAEQLSATMLVLSEALTASPFAEPERPIWLGRLADFVMLISKKDILDDGLGSRDLIAFADAVKEGNVKLTLAGASHIFVHDEDGKTRGEPLDVVNDSINALQILVYRHETAALLRAFASNQAPEAVFANLPEGGNVEQLLKPLDLVKPWGWADSLSIEWISSKNQFVAKADGGDIDLDVEDEKRSLDAETESIHVSEQIRLPENKTNTPTLLGASVAEPPYEQKPSLPVIIPDREVMRPVCLGGKKTPLDGEAYAPIFARLVAQKGQTFAYSVAREIWAKNASEALRMLLVERGIPARMRRCSLTPNGCLVSFEGNAKLNSKSVNALAEELLSTKAINVVFAKAAPGQFLIFINDATGTRESVSMWSAWNQRRIGARQCGVNLSFIIGLKETDGELLYFNPTEQDPHTLIAGGTGSGKTVLMQTMLLDMAATNPSSRLKFYIIDPKHGIDYGPIQTLPHMAAPLVFDKETAKTLLNSIVDEMERRYDLFSEVGAKDLNRYNAKVETSSQLPVLFVVHDELPNWMIDEEYEKSVTNAVTKLATKSRAAGIYLIFLAQRPDKDVMPMQVRDNLGNRLVLKLPANASEIALGEKGAENLLGKGHMVAKLNGQIYYAQVPFINEENGELDEAVEAIKAADEQWI